MNKNLPNSSAQAMHTTIKKPRPFLIRLGIGLGIWLRDIHRGLNKEFWPGEDQGPIGLGVMVLGSLVSFIFVACFCGGIAIATPYTISALMSTPIALIIGFLPAEIVLSNIFINALLALPAALSYAIGVLKGIKQAIESRIPNE